MAIHRNTGQIGGTGAPFLHVPGRLIIGALAAIAAVGAGYVAVALSVLSSTMLDEPSVAPQAIVVAPPALEVAEDTPPLGAVTHLQTNLAEVDSEDFILQQAGIAPAAETKPMISGTPLEILPGTPGTSVGTSTSRPGKVEIGMAEEDTQTYILSQAGPALRNDLAP
jgi:hypothetical protein